MTDSQHDVSDDTRNSPDPTWEIGLEDRYDRLRLIGWWDQARLASAKVLVVGAGALGNEALKNLALVGVGQILVIDFDRVEISNLSRAVLFRAEHQGRSKAEVAADMARQLNADCRIVGWQADVLCDIGLGLIRDADVVIGCVDNREARLWINRLCWKAGTPWIDGGIQEINGVCKVFVPGEGGCYECAMTENDYRLIQLRYSCPLLSREDMQQGKVPTAPTIASIIGGLQVQEALKVLHCRPVTSGAALVFNGDSNRCYQTAFPVRPDCLSHERYEPIVDSPLSSQATVAELFDSLCPSDEGGEPRLELDRDWLIDLACGRCDTRVTVRRPLGRVTQRMGICEMCGEAMQPHIMHNVVRGDEWQTWRLGDLGIPPDDIVKVRNGNRVYFVRLVGDQSEHGNRLWN